MAEKTYYGGKKSNQEGKRYFRSTMKGYPPKEFRGKKKRLRGFVATEVSTFVGGGGGHTVWGGN